MMPVAFGRINARRLAVALAASLPLLSGPAQATQLYDTTRVLQQQGNACVGATGCKVIESKSRRIKPGAAADIAAGCPDARPFLVNWDASHHEHIGIRQSERKPRKVTVVAINHAEAPGRVTLYLGCATKDPGRTPELVSVEALPSKALKGIRR